METQKLTVSRLNIHPCVGCFSCWSKTPGQCCIADDMSQVIERLLWADVTVWSFPLYYFSVPGPLKNLIDRLCGKENYTTLFCGQGELFRVPDLKGRTDEYLGCGSEDRGTGIGHSYFYPANGHSLQEGELARS